MELISIQEQRIFLDAVRGNNGRTTARVPAVITLASPGHTSPTAGPSGRNSPTAGPSGRTSPAAGPSRRSQGPYIAGAAKRQKRK
jgi:hypothetical protein